MEGAGANTATGTQNTGAGANGQGSNASNSSGGSNVLNNSNAANANSNGGNTSNQQTQQNNNRSNGENESLERLIQSAVDRATQKLGSENKKLRSQIQQLQTLNMTDAEKHEAILKERERAVQEREDAVKTEKNRMYALKKIKAAGLDDGTETALGLIDLVMSDEESNIDERVESLNAYVKKLVTAEINKTFVANGRQPGSSNNSGGDNNKSKNATAVAIGKKTAETNKESKKIIDYYTRR